MKCVFSRKKGIITIVILIHQFCQKKRTKRAIVFYCFMFVIETILFHICTKLIPCLQKVENASTTVPYEVLSTLPISRQKKLYAKCTKIKNSLIFYYCTNWIFIEKLQLATLFLQIAIIPTSFLFLIVMKWPSSFLLMILYNMCSGRTKKSKKNAL